MNTQITTLKKHSYLAPVKPYAYYRWSICVGYDIDGYFESNRSIK